MRAIRFAALACVLWLVPGCTTGGSQPVRESPARGDPEVLECRFWADSAYEMARGRDGGRDGDAIFDKLAAQPPTDATHTAINILRLVYVFVGLTPEQLREVVRTDCMGANGTPVELRI